MLSVNQADNAIIYRTTINRFTGHATNPKLRFNDIDYKLLEGFKHHLIKGGMKQNTISNYFRTLSYPYKVRNLHILELNLTIVVSLTLTLYNIMLNRIELIDLVQQLMDGEGTEQEVNYKIELLKNNVLDPKVSDYIYWPKDEMTAEQVVDKALSYKPIRL